MISIDMIELLKKIGPLPRTLACNATDTALEVLSGYIKSNLPNTVIESFPTSSKVWTWTIPQRWELNAATISCGEKIYLDAMIHPLHVINYSRPFRGKVSRDDLLKRMHTSASRPHAIPFVFSFYQETWGFCVSQVWLDEFKQTTAGIDQFDVNIDSRFEDGSLKVLSSFLKGDVEDTFVICTNICHPAQVNDSLTGVAVAADIALKLAARKSRKYSYLFITVPETIGSIAYFANHPEVIKKAVGGLFTEMVGTGGPFVGQLSRAGNTYWDLALKSVLADSGRDSKTVPFLKSAANDEKIMDSPGVDIPTVSLTRFPYPEYHTSDDCIDLISGPCLSESRDILLAFVDVIENDYIPVLLYPGPIFLSGHDLYPDWRNDSKLKGMWDAFIDVMYAIDGKRSILELVRDTGLQLSQVKYWCDGFAEKGLLKKVPKVIGRDREK